MEEPIENSPRTHFLVLGEFNGSGQSRDPDPLALDLLCYLLDYVRRKELNGHVTIHAVHSPEHTERGPGLLVWPESVSYETVIPAFVPGLIDKHVSSQREAF